LRAAVEAVAEAILFVDRATLTIVDANQAACQSLGYAAESLRGMGLDRVAASPPMDTIAACLDVALEGRADEASLEVCQRASHGKEDWHVWTAFASPEGPGPIVVIVSRPVRQPAGHPEAPSSGGEDALTGLPDRSQFVGRLANALARAAEDPSRRVAVLFVDLDDFKAANDTLGHLAGDRLLREIAGRLARCVRGGDLAARYGGDEFVVLLDGLQGPEGAVLVAERIQAQLRATPVAADWNVPITASIGIALSRPECRSPDQMLHEADQAMYRAKAPGKARYAVFQSGP
jgi:diguanylate cyclase (GGDEF)-like protein/PAS domain S-box-containing protein